MKSSWKPLLLLEEAESDFSHGCLNKCASACYFSVRKAVEEYASRLRLHVPRRDDNLGTL